MFTNNRQLLMTHNKQGSVSTLKWLKLPLNTELGLHEPGKKIHARETRERVNYTEHLCKTRIPVKGVYYVRSKFWLGEGATPADGLTECLIVLQTCSWPRYEN